MKDKSERDTFDEVICAIDGAEPDPDRHLSIQIDRNVREAVRRAKLAQKPAEVTLKLKFSPIGEGGRMQLSGAVSAKLPNPPTNTVIRFAGEDGDLYGSDPQQIDLPKIKDFAQTARQEG